MGESAISHTILIVDDEEDVLESLRRGLHREPYKILTAESTGEAFDLLKQYEIDLVLSDYSLADMTGIEFFRRIKDLYPDVMRVMLSGEVAYKDVVRAINVGGVFRFLTKPWDIEELIHTIQLALKQRKLSQELDKDKKNLEELVEQQTERLLEANKLLKTEVEERKKAEEALRESEAFMTTILTAAPVGIGLVGERAFRWVSDQLIEMLGYSHDELVGKSARMLYESDEEFGRVGKAKYEQIREHGVG